MTTPGKLTIAVNLFAMAATASAVGGVRWPLVLPYEVHKTLHVFGVVLLVGNVTVGPAWLAFAWWKDRAALPFTVRALPWMDVLFTLPGLVLVVVNGLALTTTWGGPTNTAWLRRAMGWLVVAWFVGPTFALYWQERVVATAARGELGAPFVRALVHWTVWGTLAMVPLGVVFWLMIAKPG